MAVDQIMSQSMSASSALLSLKINKILGMSGNGMAGNGFNRKPDLSLNFERIIEKIEK